MMINLASNLHILLVDTNLYNPFSNDSDIDNLWNELREEIENENTELIFAIDNEL